MAGYKINDERDPWGPKRLNRQETEARYPNRQHWSAQALEKAKSLFGSAKEAANDVKEGVQNKASEVAQWAEEFSAPYIETGKQAKKFIDEEFPDGPHESGMTPEEVALFEEKNSHGQVPAKYFGPGRDQLRGGLTDAELRSFEEAGGGASTANRGSKPKSGGGGSGGAGGGAGGDGGGAGNTQVDPEWAHLTGLAGERGELPEHEQAAYDQARQALLNKKTSGIRLKPLAALLDSWYGGNLAGSAKEPYTKEEQEEDVAGLDVKIAARKTQAKEKEQDRLDALRVNLEKARSEGKIGKMQHQLQLAQIKAAKASLAGSKGGRGGGDKDPDFAEFKTANKAEILNVAKDQKTEPYTLLRQVKAVAEQSMEEDPTLARGDAYATAFRLIKSGKLRPDHQRDDGGPNVGMADDAIDGRWDYLKKVFTGG